MNNIHPDVLAIATGRYESTRNISDEWALADDPGNDRNDVATAFFSHTEETYQDENPDGPVWEMPVAIMIGFSVTAQCETMVYPRERALAMLGAEAVAAIEDAETEDIR